MYGKSSLHAQAEAASGVSFAAVQLARESNLYERIGPAKLASMSAAFYERVYSDDPWFRGLFANTTRAAATRNQVEFLAQEFGGPRLYEQRKGATMLLGRHGPYAVDAKAAGRWLQHMQNSIEEVGFEGEEKSILLGYFKHMAWYVVYGRELLNPARTVGYYGKHREGDV